MFLQWSKYIPINLKGTPKTLNGKFEGFEVGFSNFLPHFGPPGAWASRPLGKVLATTLTRKVLFNVVKLSISLKKTVLAC